MVQYASIPGFLRTILTIVLVYYGIKYLTRIFSPILMRYVAKKAQQRFGQQFGGFQQQAQTESKKEGDVSIDKMPKSKSSNKDVGEYVDYEEVE